MKDFTFSRSFSNGKWNINNPDDRNSEGQSVTLASRITAIFPTNPFTFILRVDECQISFQDDLSAEEINTLNATVVAHESANDSPDPQTQLILVDANGKRWAVRVTILGLLTTTLIQ